MESKSKKTDDAVKQSPSNDDSAKEKFTYVTKSGKTAHVFNVQNKGNTVEFDAAFEIKDSK